MKALTLTQPWAWFVVNGGKTIENRKWCTSFRGDFLVHASKTMTDDQWLDAMHWVTQSGGASAYPTRAALEFGGIVGIARLRAVVPPHCARAEYATANTSARWHMPDQFGFVLDEVWALPFLPCKGALGFWTPPSGVANEIAKILSGHAVRA